MKLCQTKRLSVLGLSLMALQCLTPSAVAQTASYQIVDRWKNNYLCDTGENVAYQSPSSNLNCQWEVIDVAGGYKSFKNIATKDFLHIENQTGKIQATKADTSWWSSHWIFERIDNNYVWIRNRWQSNQYIHEENQNGFAQHGTIDKTWWSSQWRIQPVEGVRTSSSISPSIKTSSSLKTSSTSSASTSSTSSTISSSSLRSSTSSTLSSSSINSSISGATATYQAEDNFFSGNVRNEGSFLSNFAVSGDRAIFTVNATLAGLRNVKLRYANTSGSVITMAVYVNGLLIKNTELAPSGGNWNDAPEFLPLRNGINTITYQSITSSPSIRLDSLDVTAAQPLAARGATLPYDTYEAEDGLTTGVTSNYGATFPSIESESSGRRYVNLQSAGQFVEWTAKRSANSLIVRYNLPEAPNGGGTYNTLSLYVDGVKVKTLELTSHFAWTYGGYPFNNDNPSGGGGHHFYDESQFTGLNIPKNAKVKLQRDSSDSAQFYKIDFIELEQADSAYSKPSNFVDITQYNAKPNDGIDDTQAIVEAINYARQNSQGVWIPAGIFDVSRRIDNLYNIQIRGAGMWHTRLQGHNGQGGFYANGNDVVIADMLIASDSYYRDNGGHTAAIEGNFGTGSLIQNIWVEHMKVGFWMSPGTNGLFMVNGRIRNTWADGVNFHAGVKNSTISHFNVRNNGDDSFAMWSQPGSINENNSFRYLTAQFPILANTYAIYGGKDNKVLDSIGADTVRASSGIAISTRGDFPGGTAPFSGTTEVKRNTLNRTGGWEPNWNTTFGGLWIYADNQDITAPIVVENVDINNSTYEGVLLSYNRQITNLTMKNVRINGASTYGVRVDGVTGVGKFENVSVSNATLSGIFNPNNKFVITGSNNNGL